jgi:hypothetical protein
MTPTRATSETASRLMEVSVSDSRSRMPPTFSLTCAASLPERVSLKKLTPSFIRWSKLRFW